MHKKARVQRGQHERPALGEARAGGGAKAGDALADEGLAHHGMLREAAPELPPHHVPHRATAAARLRVRHSARPALIPQPSTA